MTFQLHGSPCVKLSWSKPLFESFWCHNDQLLSTIDAPAITMSLLLFTCLNMLLLFACLVVIVVKGEGGSPGFKSWTIS